MLEALLDEGIVPDALVGTSVATSPAISASTAPITAQRTRR